MRNERTIYLSDLLSVPMPHHASSQADYLRKIKKRRIMWALLPYLAEGLSALCMVGMAAAGLIVFAVGLGG